MLGLWTEGFAHVRVEGPPQALTVDFVAAELLFLFLIIIFIISLTLFFSFIF